MTIVFMINPLMIDPFLVNWEDLTDDDEVT